ncbi:MAG: hypothetical protein IT449_06335 [Phycisphaerales bacterium]|nr:hypothetical protein [Phycisphaerales bacterium]
MDIYLDDVRVEQQLDPSASLEEALREFQAEHVPRDRILVSLKCDGVLLTDDELREALQRPVGSCRCIEILTSTCGELTSTALGDARRALTEIDGRRTALAEMFSTGRTTDAMQGLGEMLGVWQQVHEVVVKSLAMLDLDPADIVIGDQSMSAALETPRQHLVQVRDALQTQDYVQLADVLEYEFGQAVQSWDSLIEVLQQQASSSAI